jgi:hypothetical protein
VCITATALFQAYIYMNVTSVAQKWTKSGHGREQRDEHASESNDAAAERERERERERRERVSEE